MLIFDYTEPQIEEASLAALQDPQARGSTLPRLIRSSFEWQSFVAVELALLWLISYSIMAVISRALLSPVQTESFTEQP